jgi:hypothetical protein
VPPKGILMSGVVAFGDEVPSNKGAVGTAASPETAAAPQLEIHVSARDVAKMDAGSQSDPMYVLMVQAAPGTWQEVV